MLLSARKYAIGHVVKMTGDGEAGAVGKESINTEIVTLTRFLNEEQTKHKEATGDFTYDHAWTFDE